MADFQSSLSDFDSEQIRVIAGSADPIEKAKETVEKLGITFPVAYGLDLEEISSLTGAFYEKDRKCLHATGFIIGPDNTVKVACYSTGAIGRLVAQDVLSLVRFWKSKK